MPCYHTHNLHNHKTLLVYTQAHHLPINGPKSSYQARIIKEESNKQKTDYG